MPADPTISLRSGTPFETAATDDADAARNADALVSIVLPVFNEVAVLRRLAEAVLTALAATGLRHELVFVDDGSTDGSAELLDGFAAVDHRFVVVHFSRNFGQQAAVLAGLQAARGDAVVVMDSDLQDDPAAIPRFLARWREGFDVVYAVRVGRKEHVVKRTLFFAFYRLLQAVSHTPIPADAGNFGLIDRRVVEAVIALPESSRFYPGLRHWVGFRQSGVAVERNPRHDRTPRVSLLGLFRLAKTAVFSFSTLPLALFYAVAIVSCLVCFGLTGFTLYHKWTTGLAVPGWTSGLMTASFFGMLNALGIAVLGEYVIRIFDQVRGRPLYVVDRTVGRGGAPGAEWREQRADETPPLPGHGRRPKQSRRPRQLTTAVGASANRQVELS
jgi:dolichol-phosphate mannosyltransferase